MVWAFPLRCYSSADGKLAAAFQIVWDAQDNPHTIQPTVTMRSRVLDVVLTDALATGGKETIGNHHSIKQELVSLESLFVAIQHRLHVSLAHSQIVKGDVQIWGLHKKMSAWPLELHITALQ